MSDYQGRVRAWILYDVANSAFATTILAAVFPVYYSTVAGSTLESPAIATQYYSLTLSLSVVALAIAAPILGTYADISGAKVRLLGMFAVLGIVATAGLFTVGEGDWLAASMLFGVGRIGFGAANVFYDALLPHVATRTDIDRISSRGYAFGYLGGGVLLAINVGMIFVLPEDIGTRAALLSVAVWWAAFSVPILRRVPEPPPSVAIIGGESAWNVTLRRLRDTFSQIRTAVDLRRYLLAYIVYNDAIGTVISLAAIYASELELDTVEVILALLLVQFSGIGFSLLFGRLPDPNDPRRHAVGAFLITTIVALPVVGLGAKVTTGDTMTLIAVLALLVVTVMAVAGFSLSPGRRLLAPLVDRIDTRGGIILALCAYAMIAAWGFILDSTVEFWFLALAVGAVQGGSQALSRSLYSTLIPESSSGEYFGFFSVLSKFASVFSPLLFVASVAVFGSSRPAVLSLVTFFAFGIWMLTRVNVARGQALAASREAAIRAATINPSPP